MNDEILINDFSYRTSRSGGAGGQNVNKVSTKVELLLDIQATDGFTDDEKARVSLKLASKIDKDGVFHLVSQTERTQLGNRRAVVQKALELFRESLVEQKVRKKKGISKAQKEARLLAKKRQSEIKKLRNERF